MNENKQAITFANQQIRPMADKLAQAYYQAKQVLAEWNDQNVAAVIIPGDATVIDDGSATDGRNPITNDNAYGLILQAQAFVDSMEANASANLAAVMKVAVNV